jgi:HEAT repeat protein
MRRVSEKTWELIYKLHNDQGSWRNLIGRRGLPLSLFDEIASSNEALAIPQLTAFLLNRQSVVREAVARTIGHLIDNVKPTDFAQLDEACRDYWPHQSSASSGWQQLKPNDIKQLQRLPNAIAVVGITSFHGNGFIREAAVNELANNFDGSEMPFLLVRLNDWVSVVRESAARAILQRIRPDYARHFLRNLHLVFRLGSCGRSRHDKIVTDVTALLQDPGVAPILREGILSADRWLRRESFRMAVAVKSDQSAVLLKEMLSDADTMMRLWAARQALGRFSDVELLSVLADLAQDRFMPIRREALNVFAQRFPNESPAQLNIALLDASSSVRATARYWIKTQNPQFNFAEIYRKSLNEPTARRLRAAILGLGETGKSADAEAVLPFLDVPALSIRKAAIRALSDLDGDRNVPRFVAALTCEHAGISNEATRALSDRTSSILDQLRLLFKSQTNLRVRTNLFKLMMNLNFWARGVFLFETLRDRDEQIIELGSRALRNWLTKSRSIATPPSKSDLEQLGNSVRASVGMLASHDVQEFEFLLRTFR